MNDPAASSERTQAEEAAELAHVQAQVAAARVVLIRLLQSAVEVESRLSNSDAEKLLQANEQLVIAAIRNQTEAETATQALSEATRSAELDGLTQLPNRWLLLDRFQHAIAKSRRHSERLALLFLDLDHFKVINDTFGHSVGDQVLKLVAQRILSSVREEDTASRFGGDEFVILLSDIGPVSDAIRVAEKVLAALALPSAIAGQAQGFSVSIGISFYPDDGDTAETLIECADRAMYRAKQSGRGGYALHGDLQRLALLPTESSPALSYPLHEQLREANENLVVAALGAQQLQAAAEQAQRRQTAFMASVAQELRNPMAPIRIAASMLGRDDADAPMLPRMQRMIEAQMAQLSRLVEDVVAVSHAVGGQLQINPHRLDLRALVIDVAARVQSAVIQRRQSVHVDVPTTPVELLADADRLTQLLNNLFDNASKFTPDSGDIWVSLRQTPGEVVLSVRDSGIGIAAEALDQVFEPFVQDSRSIGVHGFHSVSIGLGLGLTVVREVARAHGGEVVASSDMTGSTFKVTFPRS